MSDKLLAEWFWTDRWMGSSAFLLPQEPRGVYREMLTQAWRRGARLPNDHEAIRRATGTTVAEWKRCWPVISRYWKEEGDYLINETQVEVYAEAKAASEATSVRAKAAAVARWARKLKQSPSKARALLKHSPSSTQEELEQCPPSPSPFNGQVGSKARARNELMDRAAAEKEALTLCREIATAEDVDGTEVMRAESMWKGRGYVNPATMPDDRLAHALVNLRARAAKLHADPNSHMTPGQRRAMDGE